MLPCLFHIPIERCRAKWTRFAWEARQSCSIDAHTAGQDAPAATGFAFADVAQLSPRALYHRPQRRQSTTAGKITLELHCSLKPGSALVAKNLHLTDFLLIFHGDSTE